MNRAVKSDKITKERDRDDENLPTSDIPRQVDRNLQASEWRMKIYYVSRSLQMRVMGTLFILEAIAAPLIDLGTQMV